MRSDDLGVDDDEDVCSLSPLPLDVKNYISPGAHRSLQAELQQLWKVERPVLVDTITWAA